MADKKYKQTKKEYSRKYRKENPEKITEYNRKTVKERASRNKARAEMEKIHGKAALKNKSIDHVDTNPLNNSKSNLKIRKKHHSNPETLKGNKNAKK